jgi:hypothetical protein
MKRVIWLLAALGIGVAVIVKFNHSEDTQEETVYVKNIPYLSFLGHVTKEDGKLKLIKNFPLWEDDWRDVIWSERLDQSPMDKINFHARRSSKVRQGIVLYTYDRKWRVIWFDFKRSERMKFGRLAWQLMFGDFTQARPNWNAANGEMEVLSRNQIQDLGIQDMIEWQEKMLEVDKHNAKVLNGEPGSLWMPK